MNEWKDRVAVITGAGSGIGRGMALAFAQAGLDVVIADIDLDAAERVANEVEALGRRSLAQQVDVVDRSAVVALAEHAFESFGAVHVLCNNAGVTTFGLMCEGIPEADWDWVLAVNLHGVVHGLEAFLPRMRDVAGRKHVVNTASIAGIGPSPLVGPYSASKHAVVGLSETLRAEGQGHQISCSVLCPSNVNTGIVDADRNRQTDFGGPSGAGNDMIAAHVAQGLDPLRVGEMVRQAVFDDIPFIFTHADTRQIIEDRYAAMQASLTWAEGWRTENPPDESA
jgi:NAD(P)-dependent dehydrogenase (short-subunit alcohol dehydrogenase family)